MELTKYQQIGAAMARDVIKNGLSLKWPDIVMEIGQGFFQTLRNELRIPEGDLSRLTGFGVQAINRVSNHVPHKKHKSTSEDFARYAKDHALVLPDTPAHPEAKKRFV